LIFKAKETQHAAVESARCGSTKLRTETTLKPTLDNRLAAYLALGAAGVSALAATPAEAKVVYTAANTSIGSNLALDLNHDGVADFTFRTYFASRNHILGLALDVTGNAVIADSTGFAAAALPLAAPVAPAKKFISNDFGGVVNMANIYVSPSGTSSNGPWLGANNKFLGFKFLIKAIIYLTRPVVFSTF
jgi:hypothetical protein